VSPHVSVVVVGGGISGLVCAYELRKTRVDTQLLEASPLAGGVIHSERRDGYLLELGPQSFSGTPALLALCAELGIQKYLVQAPPRAPRYVLVDGELRPVPLSPPALLVSSLLSWATKKGIARDLFGHSQPPEQDESVANFVRRKFSAELLDRLAGPFISGIYAGDPERLSLRAAFPQLYEAEKSAGSVIRGLKRARKARKSDAQRPTLLGFREGNETLVRVLASRLGSAIRLGTQVLEVKRGPAGKGFELRIRAGNHDETITTDSLVLATPADVAGRLLCGVDRAFGPPLSAIEYAPVAIVSFGYRRPDVGHSLDGFGFLVPRSAGLRVLGTVWNSSLFRSRAPAGHVLLTSFVGGVTDPQAVTLSPESLVSLVHGEIGRILNISLPPVFSNVAIYPRALPQYNLGHSDRLAAIEKLRAELPNLWLVGNYLQGPSIGACIEQSHAVAAKVLARVRL
jgi:protoporphyrinogen/coproporphyrinogen III oxidase